MRVLFIVPWPAQSGPFRFRVGQYLPYLRENGIECVIRPFVSPEFFQFVYKPGLLAQKAAHFMSSCVGRLVDILRASEFDLVFIQRESFPYGPAFIESIFASMDVPFVFDFDDAVYVQAANPPNRWLAGLKCPGKTASIIRRSKLAIAGNSILKAYAEQFNSRVILIPTPVDTDEIAPRHEAKTSDKVVIGWTGSPSTVAYLHTLDNVFKRISESRTIQVEVYGGRYECDGVDVVSTEEWTRSGEMDALARFDIGLMPLPDDEWTRGKCGFKLLEYMAAGIPAVASPVGANKDIVSVGETGFLADSVDEWVEHLMRLIDDQPLRTAMGRQGREVVLEKYSVKANAPKLLKALKDAVE